MDDLTDEVKKSLVKSVQHYEYNASIIDNIIYDCTAEDFVELSCQNRDGSTQLQPNKQYTLKYQNGNAIVELQPEWLSPDNTIFVDVIRIGRES